MKAKHLKLSGIVCAVSLVGFVVWRVRQTPPPSVSFVEYRAGQYGEVAVFRATNISNRSFSYTGYGPSMPWIYRQVSTRTGFQPESVYDCGTGVGCFELPPHATVEFQFPSWHCGETRKPVIGIYFHKATPKHLMGSAPPALANLWYLIRERFPRPDPTWSQPPP